jgi:hypothetical protein
MAEMEESMTVVTGIVDDDGSTASDDDSGCDTHSYFVRVVMSDDVWLWEYRTNTFWCWDGTQITNDPESVPYGYVYQWFWSYKGTAFTLENGEQGDLTHFDYNRGHFKFCITKWTCTFSSHPTVSKQQYYDGDTWEDSTQDS